MAFEDFNTYTVVDPDGELSVSTNGVNVADYDRDNPTYIYKDYGAGFFAPATDFSHRFEIMQDNDNGSASYYWFMLANSVGSAFDLFTADAAYVAISWYQTRAYLRVGEDGREEVNDSTDAAALVAGTTHYVTLSLDADGGTGNGAYTAVIRTGSHGGTVVDTLTKSLLDPYPGFRYLYTTNGWQGLGDGDSIEGFTRNVDLGLGSRRAGRHSFTSRSAWRHKNR
jgi:hypothetical protein